MSRPRFVPGSVAIFNVKNRSGKKPLVTYLASRLGVVDAWAEDLLAGGHVRLDDAPVGPGALINLSAGPHAIRVEFPETWPKHMGATPMFLDVIHEDDRLVALNKPPGVVVHPARGHLDNQTLQNGIRHRYRHLLGRENTTLGSPHRLDKDTSGAIVFAIDRETYAALVEQFSSSLPHKEYLAVLDGDPDFEEHTCSEAVGGDPERKGLGRTVPESQGGKAARTDFRILERGRGWALALAVPHTGRPHQIRIHAASLGLPLAGDRDYNPTPERLGFARQALHAVALAFTHPATGRELRVEAPLAGDMRQGIEALKQGNL